MAGWQRAASEVELSGSSRLLPTLLTGHFRLTEQQGLCSVHSLDHVGLGTGDSM